MQVSSCIDTTTLFATKLRGRLLPSRCPVVLSTAIGLDSGTTGGGQLADVLYNHYAEELHRRESVSRLAGVPGPGLQLAIRQFPAPTSATHSSPLITLLSNFSRQSLLDFELGF